MVPTSGMSTGQLTWFLIMTLVFAVADARIKTVHLIFANHLDIGYHINIPGVVGNDAAVLSQYMTEFTVMAAKVSDDLRKLGGPERYRYLTHSFLVSLFLDCPSHIGISCPSSEDVATFEAAVHRGDIMWHALPHNFQTELMDVELLQYAVRLGRELDQRFGLPLKKVMSQRDVPGLTRAAIPILADAGVTALSVGVNSGSAPPAVPKNTPFIWRDERSNTSLFAFWHPGGYSGLPVDSAEECVTVEGFEHALCAAWQYWDNAGPHSVEQVLEIYTRVRESFPGAEIIASTLDDFVTELEAAAPSLDLPVVTQEIGDTWIYGVGSDPAKVSEYRSLLRFRRASQDRWDDAAFKRFSRLLLKVPEHTWGLATNEYPGEFLSWNNTDLQRALNRNDEKFLAVVDAWKRQRNYNVWAVEELERSELGAEAQRILNQLHTLKQPPVPKGPLYSLKFDKGAEITNEGPLEFSSRTWNIQLDESTGAINGLLFKGDPSKAQKVRPNGKISRKGGADTSLRPENCAGCQNWVSPESVVAKLVYSTYSEDSYDVIWKHYAYTPENPWYGDFGKPNATVLGGAKRQDAVPALHKVWKLIDEQGGLHVIAEALFDEDLVRNAGAPAAVYYDISSPPDSADLFIDIVWENKTATRLPEAMWLSWEASSPAVSPSSWVMSKLGQWISPLEVMRNGSMSMHGIDDGGIAVRSGDGKSLLRVRSLDAALVSPGHPTPFPRVVHLPDLKQGMHFNLVNNIWGTNYVMWWPYQESDRNMRFRFVVQLEESDDVW